MAHLTYFDVVIDPGIRFFMERKLKIKTNLPPLRKDSFRFLETDEESVVLKDHLSEDDLCSLGVDFERSCTRGYAKEVFNAFDD